MTEMEMRERIKILEAALKPFAEVGRVFVGLPEQARKDLMDVQATPDILIAAARAMEDDRVV